MEKPDYFGEHAIQFKRVRDAYLFGRKLALKFSVHGDPSAEAFAAILKEVEKGYTYQAQVLRGRGIRK